MDALQLMTMNDARAALGLDPLPPTEVLAGRNPGSWYRDWEHPRDREGQWITKGGLLRALIGKNWKTGTARSMNRNNTVTVETEDGDLVEVHPKNIIADIKGVIPEGGGKPGRVPDAPMIPNQPIQPERGDARTAHMREATPEERVELGIGPRVKAKVLIDPDRQGKALWGVTLDKDGKVDKSIYSPEHHSYQAALKYHRTELMDAHYDSLLDSLRRDATSDPSAGAALVMAATGMRPSSEEGAKQKGDKERTYGATTLESRHATFGTDSQGREYVRFQFVGKSGKAQDIASYDPDLIAAVKAHQEGKAPEDQLFTGASPDSTGKYIKDHTDPELKNKDLRTYQANMLAASALAQIQAQFPGGPKNQKEFEAMRLALGKLVSSQLGNTFQVALNSYINPNIFTNWAAKLPPEVFDSIMEELWSTHSQT